MEKVQVKSSLLDQLQGHRFESRHRIRIRIFLTADSLESSGKTSTGRNWVENKAHSKDLCGFLHAPFFGSVSTVRKFYHPFLMLDNIEMTMSCTCELDDDGQENVDFNTSIFQQ